MCVCEAHSSYYRVTSNKNDKIVHTYSRIHESEFYTVTDLYGTLNLLLDVATLCGSYSVLLTGTVTHTNSEAYSLFLLVQFCAASK